jgi:ABC-type lipoprotein export system ATPase subunit
MKIILRNLIPIPVKELQHEDSEVWEANQLLFEQGKSYLLHAWSGKGKTSLLSVIYGLRMDYQGDVFIDERNIRTFNEKDWSELRKKEISYVFQGLELFGELTMYENIQLKNRQTKYKSEQEIQNMAHVLEIDNFLNRKADLLSFGQKQRLAIIRALCQPFNFLFADEIFSHLDENVSKKAYELILDECSSRQAGLLFTSLHIHKKLKFDKIIRI